MKRRRKPDFADLGDGLKKVILFRPEHVVHLFLRVGILGRTPSREEQALMRALEELKTTKKMPACWLCEHEIKGMPQALLMVLPLDEAAAMAIGPLCGTCDKLGDDEIMSRTKALVTADGWMRLVPEASVSTRTGRA